MRTVVFAIFDSGTVPMSGLTPVWETYLAVDGSTPGAEPAIEAVGGGLYRVVDMPDDHCGIIDAGTLYNRRVFVPGASGVTFVAWDTTPFSAAGLTGLTPTWTTVRNAATGVAVSPQPTFTELGGGIYRVNDLADDECGIVLLGGSANPIRTVIDIASASGPSDSTPPVISNVSPANGSPIRRAQSVSIDVTDASPGLRRVVLIAKFADAWEVVHDGGAFGPLYDRASLRAAITNGYRFTISRVGGWPSSPTLLPIAIDQAGNENT